MKEKLIGPEAQKVSDQQRRTGHLQLVAVIFAIIFLLTQLSVIRGLRDHYFRHHHDKAEDHSTISEKADLEKGPQSISEILEHLPEPEVDELNFLTDVVRPQEEMLEKFPKHPDMVLQKLEKIVEKERARSKSLQDQVNEVRTALGISSEESKEEESVFLRKLQSLEMCPVTSPHLMGPLVVKLSGDVTLEPGSSEFSERYGSVQQGGSFKPEECEARQKVAIIIPFRNRHEHLKLFLYHMHPVLQRQQLDYQIFVIEQAGEEAFNRAALMNVGYVEAMKVGHFDCFVFHDVDLVPEDDRNIYTCPKNRPKHLAVAVNKWKYKLIYQGYFGGVTALSKDQFEDINGFSNAFYGWGGEDDDLWHRVKDKGYKVFRYPGNIARYSMLKHNKESKNENLEEMMERSKNNVLTKDGLTTLKYKKLNARAFPLYTWVLVKLPKAPKFPPKSFWRKASDSLWSGMEMLGGGLAKEIAAKADNIAKKNEQKIDDATDNVY